MKTVRDYLTAAHQFTHVWDEVKISELIKRHGVDLSMLKLVEIRRIQKAVADVRCWDCVFSRAAKVWTMCDKHHCRAKGVCNDLQLKEDIQAWIDRANRRIAEIRDAKDYEAFLALTTNTVYAYDFYHSDYISNFYDCYIDESIAREALLCLAKKELEAIEDRIELRLGDIAKYQEWIADNQNRLTELREQINRTNDFIASLI